MCVRWNNDQLGQYRRYQFCGRLGEYRIKRKERVKERSMFIEKLREGWIIAVHKIRKCWRRMGNVTRRKNVTTEVFGYRRSIGELVIFNKHKIGKWSVGEICKEMTVGVKVELADVITRSRVWECRWVGNETCWVKLAWSRSDKNCMALESVR